MEASLDPSLLKLQKKGWDPVMHVHDEVMLEVPDKKVDAAVKDVKKIMTKPPKWLKGLPMETEIMVTDCYEK